MELIVEVMGIDVQVSISEDIVDAVIAEDIVDAVIN